MPIDDSISLALMIKMVFKMALMNYITIQARPCKGLTKFS